MKLPMTPEDVDFALVEAFHAGDLDAAIELHEPECITWALPHEGGHLLDGRDAIRAGFKNGLFQIKGKMSLIVRHITRTGDLALMRSSWKVVGRHENGMDVEIAHSGIEVVRQQADGSWKFAIDRPWGCNPNENDHFASPPVPGEIVK